MKRYILTTLDAQPRLGEVLIVKHPGVKYPPGREFYSAEEADAILNRAYALLNRAAWLLDGNTTTVDAAPKFVREAVAFLRTAGQPGGGQ